VCFWHADGTGRGIVVADIRTRSDGPCGRCGIESTWCIMMNKVVRRVSHVLLDGDHPNFCYSVRLLVAENNLITVGDCSM
jgi:hypothetical protein